MMTIGQGVMVSVVTGVMGTEWPMVGVGGGAL